MWLKYKITKHISKTNKIPNANRTFDITYFKYVFQLYISITSEHLMRLPVYLHPVNTVLLKQLRMFVEGVKPEQVC